MGRTARTLAVAAAAALLLMVGADPSDAQGLQLPDHGFEVGEPFPLISFSALDGTGQKTLADFRGRKLIVHVFASW